jgi:hypothetical protein
LIDAAYREQRQGKVTGLGEQAVQAAWSATGPASTIDDVACRYRCHIVLLPHPPSIAWRRSRGIAASANPRWRLTGTAGLLLTGIDNGCWW